MRALLVVCVLAGTAHAGWKVARGTLERGRRADSFILSSDGAPGRYSEASMISDEAVALPYTLSATWRRFGPEAGRSMHVLVAGGVVLIKQGAIAFYAYDDTAFAQGDWTDVPGHKATNEYRVTVKQDRRGVTVLLDDKEVAHYDLPVARDTAHVGFGMKSAPGLRTAIYLRDITVGHSTD